MKIHQRNLFRRAEFAVAQLVKDALLKAVEQIFVGGAEGLVVAYIERRRGGRALADGNILVRASHQPHERSHHRQLGGGFGNRREQIGLEHDALLAASDRRHTA